eukprot:TRINITY_DN5359_c0_g2_i1.p1 TRINITY_DN5359_c0_g2~~TRINITY_DN5359_c0_g2_i1.p1  ORF type:complete len:114 (+),score=19.66 TRINITY_DN5359_c0_g2_i1:99-440(+)
MNPCLDYVINNTSILFKLVVFVLLLLVVERLYRILFQQDKDLRYRGKELTERHRILEAEVLSLMESNQRTHAEIESLRIRKSDLEEELKELKEQKEEPPSLKEVIQELSLIHI